MTAAEINKALFDAVIHQQIAVGRYGASQARDIIKLLNEADSEIIAKIAKRGEDGTFTTARFNALLKEIRSTIDDCYSNMQSQLRDEMTGLAAHSSEVATAMLASQLPVNVSVVGLSEKQLLAIIDKTPISIGKDSKLLLEEIFKSLAAGKEEKIRGAIRLGMVEGETIDQMTRRLKGTKANQYKDGILEGPRRDMQNIVHTVVQHTNNTAIQHTIEANAEVVKGWVYVATLDSKTCPVCFSQSGKTFPLKQGPRPPQHVCCRCTQAPAVKTWKELGFDDMPEYPPAMRSSSSGVVRADISFNDWLKDQPAKTQRELLGPTRAKLFADGKLTLDKFTDSSGELYALAELKSRYKA